MSSIQHALQPDKTLKDVSEITWTFDVDKALPFPLDIMSGSMITPPYLPSLAGGISRVCQMTCISCLPCHYLNGLNTPSVTK
jgi:hypothetical protein